MIDLSVIIPHYNSVLSLYKLLQTIPDNKGIQVIVVDDNSDMGYKEELQNLKMKISHKNIEFYNNNSNIKGAGSCRNIGLKKARGKWLIFADADDYFLGDFYDIVKKYFSSKFDVVFFKPTSIEVDTGKLADRHQNYEELINNYLNNKNYKSEMFIRYYFHVPWSKLIKTDLIKENNIYFDEVIASNDMMFSAKAGHRMNCFKVSEEIIYCVTRSKGSLTTTISHEIFDSRLDVYINYYNFLKDNVSNGTFKLLNVSGRGFIIQSLNFGITKTIAVYFKLKRNNVHILNKKVFNPLHITKKILSFYRKKKDMKRYYKRIN